MRITKPDQLLETKGFLVLEGLNGAGKSTLQARIAEYCRATGQLVVTTREPGGTEFGVAIRSLVLTPRAEPLTDRAELFLFSADRSEHVAKKIKPALASGNLVLSDRYYYSSVAFQGYGRGFDPQSIIAMSEVAIAGLRPDLVLLLDLDPAVGLARSRDREGGVGKVGVDTFEAEALDFHRQVRNGFLAMATELPEAFLVVDAATSADAIFSAVQPFVDRWLAMRCPWQS